MVKRILIVVVAVVFAVLAINLVGVTDTEGSWRWGFRHHRGNIPINWEVAGTIVIVQVTSPSPTGYSGPAFLIDAFLKGAPGNAQFRVLAAVAEGPPEIIPECGGPGQFFQFDDMVIIFEDLSMLFAKMNPDLQGWSCFTGEPAVANMEIIGGTGRYEGASVGAFRIESSVRLVCTRTPTGESRDGAKPSWRSRRRTSRPILKQPDSAWLAARLKIVGAADSPRVRGRPASVPLRPEDARRGVPQPGSRPVASGILPPGDTRPSMAVVRKILAHIGRREGPLKLPGQSPPLLDDFSPDPLPRTYGPQ